MLRAAGIGETKMFEEYVKIDNLVLANPLEQGLPESTITIINFVEPVDAFDQEAIEVF